MTMTNDDIQRLWVAFSESSIDCVIKERDYKAAVATHEFIKEKLIAALDEKKDDPIAPVHEMTDEDKFHQEYYRPLYSTEFVKRSESPELDELRNELYRDEILLGGSE